MVAMVAMAAAAMVETVEMAVVVAATVEATVRSSSNSSKVDHVALDASVRPIVLIVAPMIMMDRTVTCTKPTVQAGTIVKAAATEVPSRSMRATALSAIVMTDPLDAIVMSGKKNSMFWTCKVIARLTNTKFTF